jgi:hypothetical protein
VIPVTWPEVGSTRFNVVTVGGVRRVPETTVRGRGTAMSVVIGLRCFQADNGRSVAPRGRSSKRDRWGNRRVDFPTDGGRRVKGLSGPLVLGG